MGPGSEGRRLEGAEGVDAVNKTVLEAVSEVLVGEEKLQEVIDKAVGERWYVTDVSRDGRTVGAVIVPQDVVTFVSCDEIKDMKRDVGADSVVVINRQGRLAFSCTWEVKS